MKDLIQKIIEKKIHCYFISPHLDDAAFSAGSLISYLSNKTQVTVVNIFTNSGTISDSLSAKAFLKQCAISDSKKLFDIRKAEDKTALLSVNVSKIDLNYTDALWRQFDKDNLIQNILGQVIPEFKLIYPTYRFNIIKGIISSRDNTLVKQLKDDLLTIINPNGNNIVFCPIGFGNHVDHLITRTCCTENFENNIVYWSDLPYSHNAVQQNSFILENKLTPITWENTDKNKYTLANLYKSQIDQVIQDKSLLFYPEVYYIRNRSLAEHSLKFNTSLTENLINDWKVLWSKSENKNYFNSPTWFQACVKTFNYTDLLILTCYSDSQLVAVLPLVSSYKHGLRTYCYPGEQYLEKSSLLLLNYNPDIVKLLVEKLSHLGNYYLMELDKNITSMMLNFGKYVHQSVSSSCLKLETQQDPHRYFKSVKKNKIMKIISSEGERLTFKTFYGNITELLPILIDIENKSYKKSMFMDILNDLSLTKLLTTLDKANFGEIVTSILYYDKQPICYSFGFVIDSTYSDFSTAYVNDYKYLTPGKIVTYFKLKDLTLHGIRIYDFSRGNGENKRDFTPFSYKQYSLYYSDNILIRIYWTTLDTLKIWLERHQNIYEITRLTKNKISQKLLVPFSRAVPGFSKIT